METTFENGKIRSQQWELDNISISHSIVDYHNLGTTVHKNEDTAVRLHFGLSGDYDFDYKQLHCSFQLTGHHNNIMYSEGLEIAVSNRSKQIETFGINFTQSAFVELAKNGNDSLKRFAEKVAQGKNAILSTEWRPNNFSIQRVIQEILHCPFSNELKDLFLLSKSIELLFLQADLYDKEKVSSVVKSKADQHKLFEAKEILIARINNPPTIPELSKLVQLNEYKLKKGFKELFDITVFGYIHQTRMNLAKRLLLGTDQSAKEIAFTIGYSSPQHFSKAFKKEFGTAPNSIRNHPDFTIDHPENTSNLSLD